MFKKNKLISKLSKKVELATEPKLDEKNRHLIEINVSDDTNFISPYATNGTPTLSKETAEFLEHSIKHIKSDSQLHFQIKSKVIDDNEKVLYKKAIRNYYAQEIAETKSELKHNSIVSLIMALVGALLFASIILLDTLALHDLFLRILDVVAWVFVWESVDVFFLRRYAISSKQLKYLKIMTAEISFLDEK